MNHDASYFCEQAPITSIYNGLCKSFPYLSKRCKKDVLYDTWDTSLCVTPQQAASLRSLFLRPLDVMAHARTTLSQSRCSTPFVAEISLKPNFPITWASHGFFDPFQRSTTILSQVFGTSKAKPVQVSFWLECIPFDIVKWPLTKGMWGRWKVILPAGRFAGISSFACKARSKARWGDSESEIGPDVCDVLRDLPTFRHILNI